MWFSCFLVLSGSAEAQVIWGGILKHLLIVYFIGNISAKKCQNLFMCVKKIASHMWVFWVTLYVRIYLITTIYFKKLQSTHFMYWSVIIYHWLGANTTLLCANKTVFIFRKSCNVYFHVRWRQRIINIGVSLYIPCQLSQRVRDSPDVAKRFNAVLSLNGLFYVSWPHQRQ